MNQLIQEEWLKILGKGMVTLPKKWREDLGISEGDIVKAAKKDGKRVVIEVKKNTVPYRIYSDADIEQFLKEDKLPKSLARKAKDAGLL